MNSCKRTASPVLGVLLGAWGAWAQAEPVAAVPSGGSGVEMWQVFTMFVYLAILAGGALLVVRWKRQRGDVTASGGRQIEVVEARRVTPSATVMLLRVRGKSFVAMTSATGVALQALPDEAP